MELVETERDYVKDLGSIVDVRSVNFGDAYLINKYIIFRVTLLR